MENISVFSQSFLLFSGGVTLLGLFLGIVFYSWSLKLFKKLDIQIKQMKQNIDSLEALSQFVYETSYREMQKMDANERQIGKISDKHKIEQHILEIKDDIRNLIQKKPGISKTFEQKENEEILQQKSILSLNTGSEQFLSEEEKVKYQQINKLILRNLQELLKEKNQVTAQELVYVMPDNYSLADIYRTLELMKEKKQINWSDSNISPQTFLELIK